MSWKIIQARFKELTAARDSGADLDAPWSAFREAVVATRNQPPYHLLAPLRLAEDAAARRGLERVLILDDGCGGGSTLLYLLAQGYTGIYGVDVGGSCAAWNRLLREQFGIEEVRFSVYDGTTLPFADESFDLTISEEVVEHIPDAAIENYYREGARVLRPDGIAYFTAPHRLAPYDSHTRTWFIHYLPRPLARRLYGWKSQANRHFFDNHLFLRWPRFHRAMLSRLYGVSEDLTRARLGALVEFDYYDGPRGLRERLGRLCRLPGIGTLATYALQPLLMGQSISRKQAGRLPAIYD